MSAATTSRTGTPPVPPRPGEFGTDGGVRRVSSGPELLAAVGDPGVAQIVVVSDLTDVPTLRFAPGQGLRGEHERVSVRFKPGQDGVQLSTNNALSDLTLATEPDRAAVFNDTAVDGLGILQLRSLRVTGTVRLLASGQVRGGHVEAHGIHLVEADARGYDRRPAGYGVEVIPGAFMLWNQQGDAGVRIRADLTGLSAGRAGAPVRGSGIFVSGAGNGGGQLVVRRLETGEVHSDGGIAPGTADRISGGVFTVYGAVVDSVRNLGPVTTYGPNDMVLDNWGTVDRWVAEGKVTSFGPSGIGFVNFGTLELLQVADIETFGLGARGFNVYSGTVRQAEFGRVVTRGDGAVGIQISQPIGTILVRRGLETWGSVGDSLVKGVVTKLPATALSVKPGGSARRIEVAGGLVAHGERIDALEMHGTVEEMVVAGGFGPIGGGFEGM